MTNHRGLGHMTSGRRTVKPGDWVLTKNDFTFFPYKKLMGLCGPVN